MRVIEANCRKLGESVVVLFQTEREGQNYTKDTVNVLPSDRVEIIDWSFLCDRKVHVLAVGEDSKNYSVGSLGDKRMRECIEDILAVSPAMAIFSSEGHEGTVKGFMRRFRRNDDGSSYTEL